MTFSEASFAREYCSTWAGASEDAFFNSERIDRNRIIKQPEYEYSMRSTSVRGATGYYVLGVDVGRKACDTVVTVVRVSPQPSGPALKTLVNIFTIHDAHFEEQAKELKKLYFKFKAKRMVLDFNGPGLGLADYMVKAQTDPETGDYYPPFGVYNDKDGEYKKYRTHDTEDEALYLMKATAPINTVAYSTLQSSINSGKLKFLVDERTAKVKLLGTKVGQNMSAEQRADYLRPFVLTSVLKEEMLNLREENEGVNIILKRVSNAIQKDKVSSLIYALYYIREEEESKKKRRFKASDWLMMN